MKERSRIGVMVFHPLLAEMANLLAGELEPQGVDLEVKHTNPLDEPEVLDAAKDLANRCDVIVTRADTVPLLAPHVRVPLVERSVTFRDILEALYRARQRSSRIGLVLHRLQDCDLGHWPQVLDIEVHKELYEDIRGTRAAVEKVVAHGAEAVVGSVLATMCADSLGVPHEVIVLQRRLYV